MCCLLEDDVFLEEIRSFIAFDIEDESVINNLYTVQNMLSNSGASLRMVKPENIHVTMRFLGNISPVMVEKIHEMIEKIVFSPFDIEIKGLGVFPNLRRISVVWAGIRRGTEELRNIFYQLEPNLEALGFQPDDKGFSPHLTMARVRLSLNKVELINLVKDLENYEFGLIKAKCLRLKRSVLTPQGPIYSVLKETCREA